MLHFYDRATMAHALTLDLEPRLRALLSDRIGKLPDDLRNHTEFLIVEAHDTEEDVVRAIGFSPLVEPIDSARFGEAGFQPGWDWLQEHDGWFEMIVTFGSTFAYVLLIDAANTELATLCRTFSERRS